MRRFESRWTTVEVQEGSPAIMLAGMGGSNLGIWCAHGEGRCFFPDPAVRSTVLDGGLAPVRCAADCHFFLLRNRILLCAHILQLAAWSTWRSRRSIVPPRTM